MLPNETFATRIKIGYRHKLSCSKVMQIQGQYNSKEEEKVVEVTYSMLVFG